MNEVFDEYGNYIYPTDVVLDEPNTVIGCIPTMVYPQVDGITPTVIMPNETKGKLYKRFLYHTDNTLSSGSTYNSINVCARYVHNTVKTAIS